MVEQRTLFSKQPRRRLAAPLVLIVVLLFWSPAAADESPLEFARHTERVVEGRFPDLDCEVAEDGRVLICDDLQLGLENLRRRIHHAGARGKAAGRLILESLEPSLSLLLERSGVPSSSPAVETREWGAARPLLRPQLIPSDYRRQLHHIVAEELLPGIDVAWVLDEPERYTFVLKDHLNSWGVSKKQVRDQALANLAKASRGLEIEAVGPGDPEAPGHWLAIAEGDAYDAARVLLPEVRRRIADLLGDTYFIALPNRDFLVAWSHDFSNHLRFLEQVGKDFQSRHHPLSPGLFVGSAEGVRPATTEELMSGIDFDWSD